MVQLSEQITIACLKEMIRNGELLCEWFILCDQRATAILPHVVLYWVPVCDRCFARVQRHRALGLSEFD